MNTCGRVRVAIATAVAMPFAVPALAADELIRFPARPGTAFGTLLTQAPGVAPAFLAVLIPGGAGDYRFEARDGTVTMIKGERLPNRMRAPLLERGIASYMIDAPTDVPEIPDAFRGSREHAADLEAVLEDAGLSRFDWGAIKPPVLIVHHRKDDCFATPFAAAETIAQRHPGLAFVPLPADPAGATASGKCTYDGSHNLSGLEQDVVDAVAKWARDRVRVGAGR